MRATETSKELVLHLSSDLDLRRRFMIVNEPIPGNLRFGVALEVLDRLAGEAALGYARRHVPDARVVTAAVDEIVVRRVADVTRDLRCRARVNHVGRSSMEVGIRVEADDGAHLASCYFTMVVRDGDGPSARSVAVPPLAPDDELERRRDAQAVARREAYRRSAASAAEPPSREEFALLSELHRAQESYAFEGRTAARLVAENWERTYPEQENWSKVIFGGHIMRRAYELSSICAELVATHRPVIAAVNRINFFHPVQIGDKLHLTSRVAYTEGAAICVETAIERISRDRTVRALSNSCLFTFVNVDGALALREVPPIHPANYAEDARYLQARRGLHAVTEHAGPGGWLGATLAPARAAREG